jgi:IclR family pca regulon transcriptional regulator
MAENTFEIDKKDLIEGLGKGLRVIEAFDDEYPRMTPTEVGQKCGITRTAARRYLLSLCHFGYAETDGRQFWLTPRVLRLGHSYLTTSRLPRIVQPFIQRISMQCGETVNVSVLDGHDVLYVARSNSPRVVSIGFHPGARAPAHVVAPGVVILSTLDNEQVDAWIGGHNFSRYTVHTECDPDRFRAMVHSARAQGYWVMEQSLDTGLRGISVALRDARGECKGALGMTVQMHPLSIEQTVQRMLPLLQGIAHELRPLL